MREGVAWVYYRREGALGAEYLSREQATEMAKAIHSPVVEGIGCEATAPFIGARCPPCLRMVRPFSKGTYASADKSPICTAAALAFALPPTFEICGLTNASTAPLWKTASFEEICPPLCQYRKIRLNLRVTRREYSTAMWLRTCSVAAALAPVPDYRVKRHDQPAFLKAAKGL